MSQPFTISLDSLMKPIDFDAMKEAATSGGCSSSSCGSSAKPDDMDESTWERIKDHPCYSEEAHHYFARMHVAVAPACNIQCNYCNRKYDCANESRPGVVSEKLTPDQARRKVIAVANEVPQLSVLGIAGPGDACYDWKKTAGDLRGDLQRDPRHQALHLDQRPGPARPRRRTREHERRPCDDHHQHGRSRDRREDLSRGSSINTAALHRASRRRRSCTSGRCSGSRC